jgi:para-nitrobenzyl esterase
MARVPAPAWLYRTDYQQTAVRGQSPGSVHGLEMPYVFGQVEAHPEYQRPAAAAQFPPSAEDLAWGETVRGYWVNMAKHGNPNGPGLPAWPEYRPDTDLTLVMGTEFKPVAGLDREVLDYLDRRALVRRKALDQVSGRR